MALLTEQRPPEAATCRPAGWMFNKKDVRHVSTVRGSRTAHGSSLFLLQVFPVLERLTGRLKGERSTPSSAILRSSATFREK